jgi:hypothetical protein
VAIDFAAEVYTPAFNTFARPITVTPSASQPRGQAYSARGIFGTEPMDVATECRSKVIEFTFRLRGLFPKPVRSR